MSRSLTDLLRRFRAPTVDLELARDGFSVAAGDGSLGKPTFTSVEPLFNDQGCLVGAGEKAISEALRQFGPSLPLRVLLPNPVTRLLALRLPHRTRSRRQTEPFIRWHAQRLGLALDAMHLDYAWTGKEQTEHHLFAVAAHRKLLQTLCSVATGRVVREIMPTIVPLMHENRGDCPSLIIDIHREAWALAVLDAKGNVRAARTGWRHPDDLPHILVEEARRLVNAAGEQCRPRQAICWCAAGEWPDLVEALHARLQLATDAVRNCAESPAGVLTGSPI